MCRNIRLLFNFEPPATEDEVRAAALQYVRKVSGMNAPNEANREAFDKAVDAVATLTNDLIATLETRSAPRSREVEAEKARERGRKRDLQLRARFTPVG